MNGAWYTVHSVTGVFQQWSTGLWLLPMPPVPRAVAAGSPGGTRGSGKPSLSLMGTALGPFMAVLMTLMLRCSRNHEAHYGNEAKTSPGEMSLARERCPARACGVPSSGELSNT